MTNNNIYKFKSIQSMWRYAGPRKRQNWALLAKPAVREPQIHDDLVSRMHCSWNIDGMYPYFLRENVETRIKRFASYRNFNTIKPILSCNFNGKVWPISLSCGIEFNNILGHI